jgi:hypothetical protein
MVIHSGMIKGINKNNRSDKGNQDKNKFPHRSSRIFCTGFLLKAPDYYKKLPRAIKETLLFLYNI